MQLVENQVIKQLMNHPDTCEYDGKIYKTGRMLPGTVLVFANIRERKGKYQVICKRDNQGNKIVPQKVDLDTTDDVNTFLSNVYGI
jgi:ribosomal protein S2